MNGLDLGGNTQLHASALLAASGALRLTGEDVLRAIVYNSAAGVTVTIAGRFQRTDGQISAFKFALVPTTDRLVSTNHYQLGEGWLLNVQAYASTGAPRRGQCYVGLELSRGTDGAREPLGTLAKDYIAEGQGIAWPGTGIRASTEGPGCIRSISGTNPAAGVEITETVPTNARWRVLALRALLATSAVVANRQAALQIDDGTNAVIRIPAATNHTASATFTYTWAQFGSYQSLNGVGAPLPDPGSLFLPGGYRLTTSTGSLDAGDDWAAPQLLVEEWIED